MPISEDKPRIVDEILEETFGEGKRNKPDEVLISCVVSDTIKKVHSKVDDFLNKEDDIASWDDYEEWCKLWKEM